MQKPTVKESFSRPTVAGKFLLHSGKKFWVKGVTYGTFRPRANGEDYPDPTVVKFDLAQIATNGFNVIRTYSVPPRWFLDLAQEHQLHVMLGLPWEQHVAFLEDKTSACRIMERLRVAIRSCAGHPAAFCYTIGNEIAASIVRWHGRCAIERCLERLYNATKDEDPESLVTYVNYPSTEYLELPFLDLVCFNIYLESQDRLEAYLARLQNLAGDRPLILGEIGLDSRRHGEVVQARTLDWQIRTVFAAGCVGAFVFSWTDEWHRGGCDIKDWDFGLTRRGRQPKLALSVVRQVFAEVPFPPKNRLPRVSVVVCSFNGARTIRDCLEGLSKLEYPNYEILVVDDGSTDATRAIAAQYNCHVIHTENRGLGSARNTGLKEASGEIVAYIDDDAWPDPHWLDYLVSTFQATDHAGVGGPNLPPPGGGLIADCVANAPGGPMHVLLSDQVAEHIPGCNMAFQKSCLEAIGGFDVQFRTAGDDVDVCWRLQQKGWTLGFNPAALVWHHRRNSVRAYWRQQRGYGKAEALLERKWPERYCAGGGIMWDGRMYGKGLMRALGIRTRIYHGTWGSAPFQSLYEPALGLWRSLPLMPEWYLVLLGLALLSGLGLLWSPLLAAVPILAAAVGVSLGQAVLNAARAWFAARPPSLVQRLTGRALTVFLHLLQPLARLSGRLRAGLRPWRCHISLSPSVPRPQRLQFWSERWKEPEKILHAVEGLLRAHGAMVRRGGDYDRWDLEVQAGLFGMARLLMGVEEHGAGKQLFRFRVWPRGSLGWYAASLVFAVLAAAAVQDGVWSAALLLGLMALWPLSRAAWECGLAVSVIRQSLAQLWPYARASQIAPTYTGLKVTSGENKVIRATSAIDGRGGRELC